MQRLYRQGATTASIAYLLQAAAEPLSQADGSSNALLPYLDPPILRRYAAGPRRRASPTAELLYGLALDLTATTTTPGMYGGGGGEVLQGACQYGLYKALRATFAWVRDNVPLRLVQSPAASAGPADTAAAASYSLAVPDPDRMPDAELSRAVLAAVSDPQQLGGADSDVAPLLLVEGGSGGGCGGLLSAEAFAGAVPRVAAALAGLQGDLPVLQSLGALLSEQSSRQRDRESGGGSGSGGAAGIQDLESLSRPHRNSRRRLVWLDAEGEQRTLEVADDAAAAGGAAASGPALAGVPEALFDDAIRELAARRQQAVRMAAPRSGRRRLLQAATAMPPPSFKVAPPAKLPKLLVPLIFHVMLYRDVGGGIGPAGYDNSLSYINRLVRLANYMAAPTNIQFYTKEARHDPTKYPYLLLRDRRTWQDVSACDRSQQCFSSFKYMDGLVADFPRSINIFVASDSENPNVPAGYAFAPGSDIYPVLGHAFLSWEMLLPAYGYNNLALYNDAPEALLHELFHHLGLMHPFGPGNDGNSTRTCSDDDYVSDTPVTLGSISSSSFFSAAVAYCMELFWETYGGDWEATYARWSSALGPPPTDMNTWADSCPTKAGYDELGNYMTYNTPVCYAAMGHFTRGQAEMAHYVTAELNPIIYAWGQYYAAVSPSPPAQSPPPPEAGIDPCKITLRDGCACKASWQWGAASKSYCGTRPHASGLWCEVEDPQSCAGCANSLKNSTRCVLGCGGTEWMCYRTGPRPPPPPPLPPALPPAPPPPPPRVVPEECKYAVNGCRCRSTWRFFGKDSINYWSYCASPEGRYPLFCQVESTCPGYNIRNPYYLCSWYLTPERCNATEVFLSQTRGSRPITPALPPRNPSPPPRPPPPPPPPKRKGGGKRKAPTAASPDGAGRQPRSSPPPPPGGKAVPSPRRGG
ncbi:hypothetical protein HYH02_009248 [Chlamydomonas schloesseri]|uniref:Peptidase M43 pregnancy-associated plasma-A domain-containing protein n=1 Tax=Chlamydomonas schloesseri TaxID=2026947 RepID=A0A836B0H0_9CHLO|nr:hypothetical protein HYH02_009248 [Chlamydomonas schloesseri]|eukprot:KAG2444051.1 hypothetical protein HYH02_009248 [Chlamydomonas schloesseri]